MLLTHLELLTNIMVMAGGSMEDLENRFARELSEAIAAAVYGDSRVEACHERARAAGFEMQLSLEAVVGFMTYKKQRIGIGHQLASRNSTEPNAYDRAFLSKNKMG
jgi:hypothetical protein